MKSLPCHVPENAPTDCMFVPRYMCPCLITCAHISLSTKHPGTHCTYSLLSTKHWWPNMLQEINKLILSCKMHHVQSTLLPVPSRPWSHIAFITDPPISQGLTVIMIITDWFSKSIKFIPLQAHWHFGIPEDIISDKGPNSLPATGP